MFNFLASKFSWKEQIEIVPSGISEKLEKKAQKDARRTECENVIRTFIARNPEPLQKTIAEANDSYLKASLMTIPIRCSDSWSKSHHLEWFIANELKIRPGSYIDVEMNGDVEYRPYACSNYSD